MAHSSAGVGHIVDENRDLLSNVSDEHHRSYFVGLLALFVDQGKLDVESIGDGSYSEIWSSD